MGEESEILNAISKIMKTGAIDEGVEMFVRAADEWELSASDHSQDEEDEYHEGEPPLK